MKSHWVRWWRAPPGLETRLKVCVEPGPDLAFQADPDQLEQMLINLIRNAADAVLETRTAEEQAAKAASQKNGVVVRWDADREEVTLAIEDEGPGPSESGKRIHSRFTPQNRAEAALDSCYRARSRRPMAEALTLPTGPAAAVAS